MKALALAFVLAMLLVMLLALPALELPILLVAPVSVALGVAAAVMAQGAVSWLAICFGAASPLALAWIEGYSLPVAIGVMGMFWLAPRLWLARAERDLALLGTMSAAVSALAGWIAARYAPDLPLYHVAACVFAGAALAMTTVIVQVDTPRSHALRVAAREMDPAMRELVENAANLDRYRQEPATSNTPDSAAAGRAALRQLLDLADRLVSLRKRDDDQARRERAEVEDAIRKAVGQMQVRRAA